MPYFSHFPSVSYSMDKNDLTKVQVVKDITVRAKISEYFKNSAMTSLPYEVQDGERPETLAHRIYDRSDLHWVILLFNEIHDSSFEWPLSSAELESVIATKYKGQSIYYPDAAASSTSPSLIFLNQDIPILAKANTIHQRLSDGSVISANILKWNPTYNQIVIDGEEASRFDPSYDFPNSIDGYARFFIDNDERKLLAFSRIQPYEYSVDHFEDADGNTLNPRSGPPSDVTSTSSILNRYVTQVGFTEVLAIDNRTQEYKVNENKRTIRVIKPEFMSAIVTQFRSLFI